MSDDVQRFEDKVQWWARQAAQIEKDRVYIKWVPAVAAPLAVGGAFVHPLVGGAVVATGFLTWLTGMYMTAVRRAEFKANKLAAEEDLRGAQGRAH